MGLTCHFIDIRVWEPKQITLALKDIKYAAHTGSST